MANYWWTAAAGKEADDKVSMLAVSRSRRDSALMQRDEATEWNQTATLP